MHVRARGRARPRAALQCGVARRSNSGNTSRYSCQLESQREFCEKYNYTYRMFAGNEEFDKEV